MILIKQIAYSYKDNTKKIEKPSYLSVGNRSQLEKLKSILFKANNCKAISIQYEER